MSLLKVKNLSIEFKTKQGVVKALNGVSYHVKKGEILAIVGESGSGKSVGMMALMGLVAKNAKVTSDEITFLGEDISPAGLYDKKKKKAYKKKIRKIRGNEISMIFQDPMTHLNPTLKIGTQLIEGIRIHTGCSKSKAKKQAIKLMEQVGIPNPETRLKQYPFEFSGGMRQRIIIAMALACEPKLIIADEPTTALDVTVQAQILDLLKKITKERKTSVILITHDLGVVATIADRIHIMYGGRIVEKGTTEEIFYEAKHPYTKGLLNSIHNSQGNDCKPLVPIPGTPPDLLNLPKGCAFAERCPQAKERCEKKQPETTSYSKTHSFRCFEVSQTEKGERSDGGF